MVDDSLTSTLVRLDLGRHSRFFHPFCKLKPLLQGWNRRFRPHHLCHHHQRPLPRRH